MEADAYFAMGKSHVVCQDYAAVGTRPQGGAIVALSDGCSSSPHTDFGSRFLVHAALQSPWLKPADIARLGEVAGMASDAAEALGLPRQCLDATLLVAEVFGGNNDHLTISAFGDGVIDIEFKSGNRETYSIEFEREAPAYPSYVLNNADLDLYLDKYGTRKVETTLLSSNLSRITKTETSKVTWEQYGFRVVALWSKVRRVTLCSDGVRSFRRQTPAGGFESVPLSEVMAEVTAIKSPSGAFMVRRMRRYLYDFCPKNGLQHDDDVAVASILNTDP